MTLIFLTLVIAICVASLLHPWIGVTAYYFLAVGHPQAFYPHIFQDVRVSLYVAAGTAAGFAIAVLRGRVAFRILLRRENVLLVVICGFVNLSVSFSDFQSYSGIAGSHDAEFILGYLNKSILFYLIAVLVVDAWHKLKWLLWMFAFLLVYLTYWANDVYFSGQFWRFGGNGRLNGPDGTYHDENAFALLFVMATPVLYYVGLTSSRLIVRYGLWLLIPLSWHALFLTGSRGGLLSLACVSIYVFFRSYSKRVSVVLCAGFIAAVAFQAAFLLNRVDSTIDNSTEEVADPRLVSWEVGFRMIADYPLFGVGAGNFQAAFPYYADSHPHVAHNTFLQFAAQSGLLCGLMYAFLYFQHWSQLRVESRTQPFGSTPGFNNCSGDLIRACMIGFFICSWFLDLQLYELLYFLLMLYFVRSQLVEQHVAQLSPAPSEESQSRQRLQHLHR